MALLLYLDTILVPLSLFITIGYHVFLWYVTNATKTAKGKLWMKEVKEGDDKMSMLAVQSLRNTLMATILVATITIMIMLALAALINNTYNVKHLFANPFFGVQSNKIIILKYGSVLVFLIASFLCSSMAVGNLIDANYLILAFGIGSPSSSSLIYASQILDRGFTLSMFGNRMLCIAFPLLFWMFSPVAVAVSSVALIWVLYTLDFSIRGKSCHV